MYRVEITADDLLYIKACIAEAVRRLCDGAKDEQEKIDTTLVFANLVTRLNEARLNTRDVMVINTCIQKTRDLLLNERRVPPREVEQLRKQGEQIQNKLAGLGGEHFFGG